MGYGPFAVDAIAKYTSLQMVIQTTHHHCVKGGGNHPAYRLIVVDGELVQHEEEGGVRRELLAGAEPAVLTVEKLTEVPDQQPAVSNGSLMFLGAERHDVFPSLLHEFYYCLCDIEEGIPVSRCAQRGVGKRMHRLQVRGEEDVQRPSAAAGLCLYEVHHVLVDVRPLLTVNLDAYKIPVEVAGRLRVREGFGSHHMAPVTCGITHRHKQRFLLRSGISQGLAAPLLPPYRVTGMLSQVWRRRPAEVISSPIYFNSHNISQLVLIKLKIRSTSSGR